MKVKADGSVQEWDEMLLLYEWQQQAIDTIRKWLHDTLPFPFEHPVKLFFDKNRPYISTWVTSIIAKLYIVISFQYLSTHYQVSLYKKKQKTKSVICSHTVSSIFKIYKKNKTKQNQLSKCFIIVTTSKALRFTSDE